MDKKEIIALIKKVGQEQNGCINSDGEYMDFCKGDEEYIFDNEDVNELAEKLIKLFSLHVVSKSFCNNCKSGLIDYPEINRRTCRCGALGYNVC